ncbi:MAG: twin-arginine translocase TatA/TatE family subunit [Anaerolineae bacterium]|nr:twin-arginine translocase TatA/TatE family subunit [Candidatus Roseilinea sp.]MDW8449958.1 twin-arginine translocase TatA/TatE family subunit [Anaerolineae bacterium]
MNGTILGIGPLEVLFILILILLVFGPERLPEFTRGLGTALRRLRETYVAFTQEFKGELQPIAQDLDEVTREIRREVQAIREAADIRAILQPYADDISKAVSLNPPPGTPAATNSLNGTSAPANTSAPPPAPASAAPQTTTGVSDAGAATIAPPTITSNGARIALPRPIAPENHIPVELPDDNPWASVGTTIRTDRLDDDNPWRG